VPINPQYSDNPDENTKKELPRPLSAEAQQPLEMDGWGHGCHCGWSHRISSQREYNPSSQ